MPGKGRNRFNRDEEEVLNEQRYKNPVGYCNPPKEHQWKKGQSGNPKGRPKKSKRQISQLERLYDMFDEEIYIQTENGPEKITIGEAINKKLIQNVLSTKKVTDIIKVIQLHEFIEKRHLKNEIKFEDSEDEIGVMQQIVYDVFYGDEEEENNEKNTNAQNKKTIRKR